MSAGSAGNISPMATDSTHPGPLEEDKRADDPEPGEVQPQAAEVESARLLANQAAPELRGSGLSEDDVRRLADEFIARDRSEDLNTFVVWARHHAGGPPAS